MPEPAERKKRIIELARRLTEPSSYNAGLGNSLPDLPANIILLRRDTSRRIYMLKRDNSKLQHRRYVLNLNLHQEGLVGMPQGGYYLPEDHAFLIYPFYSHHYIVNQNRFFWLVITFEVTGRRSFPDFPLNSFAISDLAWSLIERLLVLWLDDTPEHRKSSDPLFQIFLQALLFELRSGAPAAPTGEQPRHYQIEVFEKITGEISARLADPGFSATELARKCGMSTSSLYALFQQLVGCKPGRYLRTLRIKQAIALLNEGRIPVGEVAEKCGFSSPAVFSRSFHQMMGCSPSEYSRGNPTASPMPSDDR